jgi:hypothetical protein
MKARLWGGIAAVLALTTALAAAPDDNPLNFSDLRGKELSADNDVLGNLGALVKSGLAAVLSGGAGTGKIETVTVLEDRAGSLVVQIRFDEMPEGMRKLSATAIDANYKPLRGLSTATRALSGEREGQITLTLKLGDGDNRPQGSKRLIVYAQGDNGTIGARQVFGLSKQWVFAPKRLMATAMKKLPDPPANPTAPAPFNPTLFRRLNTIKLRDAVAIPSAAFKAAEPVAAVTPVVPRRRLARPSDTLRILRSADAGAVAPEAKDLGAKGPAAEEGFSFAERIEGSTALDDPRRALTIHSEIYADKNKDSGFYYYLPARYGIDYQGESGFGLQVYYDSADGSTDSVVVRVTLRAQVQKDDVQIAETFLKQACPAVGRPFRRLDPFRFSATKVNLESVAATSLEMAPDKVRVQGFGEGGVIYIDFLTNARMVDRFITLLTRGGLNGTVEYTSVADSEFKRLVPVEIRLPDRDSLNAVCTLERVTSTANGGGLRLTSVNGVPTPDPVLSTLAGIFRNGGSFPVALRYIHVLRYTDPVPTVYSFAVPRNEIGPGRDVRIDTEIPLWLADGATRVWADYAVVADTVSLASALQKATGASTGSAAAQFTIQRVGEWGDEIESVTVNLVSRYLDPLGAREAVRTVLLGPTDEAKTVGPVYLRGRQEGVDQGADDPLLTYTLSVRKKDGTVLKTPRRRSNALTLAIGAAQLKETP